MTEAINDWLDKPRVERYRLDPWPAQALAAALGQDALLDTGAPLPPFWHHLYGHGVVDARETGPDGHPKRGGFLPPIPLPRRMWAGGRLSFEGCLVLGEEVERRSVVRRITEKEGRSGRLVFVLVEHRIAGANGTILEKHDIVYREAQASGASGSAPLAPTASDWSQAWQPDEVLLFRYSALTYNGHRIHYDQRYVTAVEGYPGLIVHGPLLATFLFERLRQPHNEGRLASFDFRALQPVFVGDAISANASLNEESGLSLWIAKADGSMAMRAEAKLR